MFRMFTRRTLVLGGTLAVAAALAVLPAVPSGAASIGTAKEQHCVVNATGQKASGELVVSSMRCYATIEQAEADGASYSPASSASTSGGAIAALSGSTLIATHFDGLGWTGSTLSVYGDGCWGWINLIGAWNNRISSTVGPCNTWHYDGFNLTGVTEMLVAPGGDLSILDNRASSVLYTQST